MDRMTRKAFLRNLGFKAAVVAPWASGLLSGCAGRSVYFRQAEPEEVSRRAAIADDFELPYLKLHREGELKRRGEELWSWMEECRLCPRECGARRLEGEEGFCGSSDQLEIASHHPHYGEERPLVGRGGSGTIFLSNCSLRCVFCINWQVSRGRSARDEEIESFAEMMLDLQDRGCHNINVVTPTHYSAHILLALDRAAARGLRLPLVYNTCGWEKKEVLQRLDGVVDIYLPDFKYWDGSAADRYSAGAGSYPEMSREALLEMHRQVGSANPAPDGLMYRGLMIRHLIMPNNVARTDEILRWIARELPKDTYVNLMAQYMPVFKADRYPKINRRITREEYEQAIDWAREAGLTNLDLQPFRG